MSTATITSSRAPWETRFRSLPAAPAPSRSAAAHVAPIAIPVVGSPINGRHLVRAPWVEPLSAFAGVIVETQLVPDDWFRPRAATARVMDPPIPATPARGPVPASQRPLVAIPVVADRPAMVTTPPLRVVPVVVAAGAADAGRTAAPVARPVAVLTSLGTDARSIPATSAAPIDPVVPSPLPVAPAPSRRGLLGRAVALTVGLVVSLVAYEAAARLGRR